MVTTRTEALSSHKQKYGAMYMITLVGSLLPILTIGGYILNSFNNLATDLELQQSITQHNATAMHPAAAAAVAEVDNKLDSIIAFQVQERIEKMLLLICNNPALRAELRDTLRSLEDEYQVLTGQRYTEPSCAQLGVRT